MLWPKSPLSTDSSMTSLRIRSIYAATVYYTHSFGLRPCSPTHRHSTHRPNNHNPSTTLPFKTPSHHQLWQRLRVSTPSPHTSSLIPTFSLNLAAKAFRFSLSDGRTSSPTPFSKTEGGPFRFSLVVGFSDSDELLPEPEPGDRQCCKVPSSMS